MGSRGGGGRHEQGSGNGVSEVGEGGSKGGRGKLKVVMKSVNGYVYRYG